MALRITIPSMAMICLYSSLTTAGESGIQSISSSGLRPMAAILGGYANINAGSSATYLGTDDDVFTYHNSGGKNSGFIGAFLGAEYQLPYSGFFLQGGLEYNYFWPIYVSGTHTVGIEPDTSTLYTYQYRFETQQLLVSARLLGTVYERFHPYLAAGIGAAFNNTSNYSTATNETGSINLTPIFTDHSQTQFGYNLGAGIDTNINQHWRFGVGYRFSGFGNASLGRGEVVFDDYHAPVPFKVGASSTYANQFIAQLSYLA
ncbi:TPA: outer membrane protein [Legionella bozemanae]|uniref:outer membrane protein n=1 Tax=Legionella bozemanae TaxID=447 RepID=UPI003EEE459B